MQVEPLTNNLDDMESQVLGLGVLASTVKAGLADSLNRLPTALNAAIATGEP